MARLSVSACFALSAVLVVATGIRPGNGQLPVPIPTDPGCLQFPGGQFPSPLLELYNFLSTLLPMRIISKGNTSLSITADDKGKVFLAPTNCRDAGQLWVQHSSPTVGNNSRFSLVNVNLGTKDPLRAMQISDDGSYPVKLAPYSPLSVPSSMLWTQDAQVFGDGFHKIRSCKKSDLVLDGLNGNVHNGTVVGAYPASHDGDHVLWKTPGFLFNP
ncbi:ricin B-like lectin R40C1 [Miscanthus floridulus]|uniref:ricin B-like lectin R40C1 n=1 Tax=Miscanthus floridulus TaxID=154761 RepID=UPI00345B04C5